MRTRSKARQRAVEALFEAEQRKVEVSEVLARNPETNEFATQLCQLVTDHQNRIDEIIATYLTDRTIERMPALDRAITRIAVAELLYARETDTAVIVSEAVDLAEMLSTEQSSKFLNGLIGAVARVRENISTL